MSSHHSIGDDLTGIREKLTFFKIPAPAPAPASLAAPPARPAAPPPAPRSDPGCTTHIVSGTKLENPDPLDESI